jgi:TrmH family RNA methyltransferase
MLISSFQNPRLKAVRSLLSRRRERSRTGLFVAEGEDLVVAAAAHGWPPHDLLVAEPPPRPSDGRPDLDARERAIQVAPGAVGTLVTADLINQTSTLGSGTRAIGVYAQRWAERASGPRCVYLHGVRDPGNVGTVVRAAHALGASSVAIGPGTADPYAPKAVRASMGSIFAVPLARVDRPEDLPGTTVALVLRDGDELRADPELSADVTLLIGGERDGLPDEVVAACDRTAHLPISGAESLNAAMAATVALYELGRRPA